MQLIDNKLITCSCDLSIKMKNISNFVDSFSIKNAHLLSINAI